MFNIIYNIYKGYCILTAIYYAYSLYNLCHLKI